MIKSKVKSKKVVMPKKSKPVATAPVANKATKNMDNYNANMAAYLKTIKSISKFSK